MASAFIFGLPHMLNPHATLWTGIAIGIQAGIMLALVFVVTRNLWATIGIHAGWNFTVALLGIGDTGITTQLCLGQNGSQVVNMG